MLSGTYTVNPDCSGTQTLTVNPQNAPQYNLLSNFEFVDNGLKAVVATQNAGILLSGTLQRAATQGTSPCSVASLSGNFEYLGQAPPVGTFAPFSNIGGVTFDGKGGVTYRLAVNDSNPDFLGIKSSNGSGFVFGDGRLLGDGEPGAGSGRSEWRLCAGDCAGEQYSADAERPGDAVHGRAATDRRRVHPSAICVRRRMGTRLCILQTRRLPRCMFRSI